LKEIGIATVSDLDNLAVQPDVIHGQHFFETLIASFKFPNTPVVFFCHGVLPWQEIPPILPSILKYIVISPSIADKLTLEHGIPQDNIEIILNFVDLDRFPNRAPLPSVPRKALVFSNYATERTNVPVIREACKNRGISLEIAGASSGNQITEPGAYLSQFDIVFATGRSALEATAVGAAVIVYNEIGLGEMVTSKNYEEIRSNNFGLRCVRSAVTSDAVSAQLDFYDPSEAANVSTRIRSDANLKSAINRIVSVYEQLLSQTTSLSPSFMGDMVTALPANLLRLRKEFYSQHDMKNEINRLNVANQDLREALNQEVLRHKITQQKRKAENHQKEELLAKVQNLSDQLKEWQFETKRLEGKLAYLKEENTQSLIARMDRLEKKCVPVDRKETD
jgi:hypothetical protein